MVPVGGGSTKSVLSDRWIVYTKRRKQLLHRKYLLYETGCSLLESITMRQKGTQIRRKQITILALGLIKSFFSFYFVYPNP